MFHLFHPTRTALQSIEKFERTVFRKNKPLAFLLPFSLKLMKARQVGLLQGTNRSYRDFVPPEKWDRGVMNRFDGRGAAGLLLKWFGTWMVRFKGLSPVKLYKESQFGEKVEADGVIPFILRTHQEFYQKGVTVLIIDHLEPEKNFSDISGNATIHTYDGHDFKMLSGLKVNQTIVRQFKARNIISAYVPDYGAIVFNSIDRNLMETSLDGGAGKYELKFRLDKLISAIEMASLAHIGRARGRQAARIIWRKEKRLRKTALKLKLKERELDEQKKYLKAVGAVTEQQLNMEATNIMDGVYAFMDMVGSAEVRKKFNAREYFYILNLCHQITADNAGRYGCRVDNFIGDCVFLQNAAPFDEQQHAFKISLEERVMLMVLAISATFNEISLLKKGEHPMDPEQKVRELIERENLDIGFRAGLEIGSAMIGPLGSQKRKIVTAIGKAVNNASRLESTGLKEWIHVSEKVISILKQAYITRDNRMLRKAIEPEKGSFTKTLNFLDYYKSFIRFPDEIFVERKNISYKEYSQAVSYVIRCLNQAEPS